MANLAAPSLSASSQTACVLYCRVSSAKQLREGDGLRGQERRCREYAQSKGYEVLRVFHEEGLTGSLLDRLAMDELLAFLKARGQETVVVIEDLKRFARDVSVHFSLKLALDACGGRLESPLFRFEDTPEGRFIETIVAAQAELERNQNRRQVRSRMLSRLEAGYWVFAPPPGYRYIRDPIHKQVLVPDDRAELVREAMEGFAAGRFTGQADVVRFLLRSGFFGPGDRITSRHQNVVGRMLRQALYAGMVGYAPWRVTPREGHHLALITWETHRRILARLNTSQRPYSRREKVRADFVLRGLVSCASCGHPLTGSWSRGERQRYAYYHCHSRACAEYGKTVPKSTLEEAFCRVLMSLETPEVVMTMMEVLVTDHSRLRLVRQEAERSEAAQVLKKMEEEINVLAERIAATERASVASALEHRIEKLEGERIALSRRLAPAAEGDLAQAAQSAGTAFLAVRGVLKSPYQSWELGDTVRRHLIGRLVFDTLPAYDRKGGFGTVNLSLPYRVSRALMVDESRLVDQAGKKPNNEDATFGLKIDWEELGRYLIQFAQAQARASSSTGPTGPADV
jgi:site-specific DNA recombinase